jgi:nuclear pore complex protein Nup133
LIDAVVAKVLEKRKATPPMPHLTNQDIFYREVSKIDEFLQVLVEHVNEKISSENDTDELVSLLSSANTIIYSMLSSAVTYRTSNGILYAPNQGEEDPLVEVSPWTTSSGSKGLRTLLINQHKLTVSNGVTLTKDPQIKAALVQQMVDIADLILTEYSNQLESTESHLAGSGRSDRLAKVQEEYLSIRKKLITPLLDLSFYEKASSLAEKYADFETLILVCEKTEVSYMIRRIMLQKM